jgi:DNA primase
MIDVERLKSMIDCRDVVEHDLGQPKIRGRKYSAYKCPFHNETKGFSLVVYADHWRCFGKCGRGCPTFDLLLVVGLRRFG